ncbi:unnamed protein product [Amoebophrya sp. A120]|nr:unnamed protein product [Amoebophrya sp. A120]|eukprot:GSA120T00023038001.1
MYSSGGPPRWQRPRREEAAAFSAACKRLFVISATFGDVLSSLPFLLGSDDSGSRAGSSVGRVSALQNVDVEKMRPGAGRYSAGEERGGAGPPSSSTPGAMMPNASLPLVYDIRQMTSRRSPPPLVAVDVGVSALQTRLSVRSFSHMFTHKGYRARQWLKRAAHAAQHGHFREVMTAWKQHKKDYLHGSMEWDHHLEDQFKKLFKFEQKLLEAGTQETRTHMQEFHKYGEEKKHDLEKTFKKFEDRLSEVAETVKAKGESAAEETFEMFHDLTEKLRDFTDKIKQPLLSKMEELLIAHPKVRNFIEKTDHLMHSIWHLASGGGYVDMFAKIAKKTLQNEVGSVVEHMFSQLLPPIEGQELSLLTEKFYNNFGKVIEEDVKPLAKEFFHGIAVMSWKKIYYALFEKDAHESLSQKVGNELQRLQQSVKRFSFPDSNKDVQTVNDFLVENVAPQVVKFLLSRMRSIFLETMWASVLADTEMFFDDMCTTLVGVIEAGLLVVEIPFPLVQRVCHSIVASPIARGLEDVPKLLEKELETYLETSKKVQQVEINIARELTKKLQKFDADHHQEILPTLARKIKDGKEKKARKENKGAEALAALEAWRKASMTGEEEQARSTAESLRKHVVDKVPGHVIDAGHSFALMLTREVRDGLYGLFKLVTFEMKHVPVLGVLFEAMGPVFHHVIGEVAKKLLTAGIFGEMNEKEGGSETKGKAALLIEHVAVEAQSLTEKNAKEHAKNAILEIPGVNEFLKRVAEDTLFTEENVFSVFKKCATEKRLKNAFTGSGSAVAKPATSSAFLVTTDTVNNTADGSALLEYQKKGEKGGGHHGDTLFDSDKVEVFANILKTHVLQHSSFSLDDFLKDVAKKFEEHGKAIFEHFVGSAVMDFFSTLKEALVELVVGPLADGIAQQFQEYSTPKKATGIMKTIRDLFGLHPHAIAQLPAAVNAVKKAVRDCLKEAVETPDAAVKAVEEAVNAVEKAVVNAAEAEAQQTAKQGKMRSRKTNWLPEPLSSRLPFSRSSSSSSSSSAKTKGLYSEAVVEVEKILKRFARAVTSDEETIKDEVKKILKKEFPKKLKEMAAMLEKFARMHTITELSSFVVVSDPSRLPEISTAAGAPGVSGREDDKMESAGVPTALGAVDTESLELDALAEFSDGEDQSKHAIGGDEFSPPASEPDDFS